MPGTLWGTGKKAVNRTGKQAIEASICTVYAYRLYVAYILHIDYILHIYWL